jgi:hypothetical protein
MTPYSKTWFIVAISARLFQGSNTDRPVLSRLVYSLKRRGAGLLLMGLAIFLLACARVDMERAGPLADAGKLVELEKLVDQALEMLGETEKVPEVYRKK